MRLLSASLAAASVVCIASAHLGTPLPPCISAPGGTPRVADVSIPQQGGGTLTAKLFAPDAALQIAPCPCITMLPGGGAGTSSVEWAANQLARNGYVVIITLPASGERVVDDSGFVLFAAAYENLFDLTGDLNANGVTDDSEVVFFASAYNALLCP